MVEVLKKINLSELNDDVEISIEETSTVYTVAELKREIVELGEPHHESDNWYTIIRKKWSPDAQSMLEGYIESEYENMYENWDERAWDCVSKGAIKKIQDVLDEAFKSDYATSYWEYDVPVNIDIFPNK